MEVGGEDRWARVRRRPSLLALPSALIWIPWPNCLRDGRGYWLNRELARGPPRWGGNEVWHFRAKFLIGKSKFWRCAGSPRSRDKLLGLLQTAPKKLSPQHTARLCASRFLRGDYLPERLGSGDLELHLFAARWALLMRSIFADPDCPASSAHPCGRRALVKCLLGWGFVATQAEGHQFGVCAAFTFGSPSFAFLH